MFLATSSLVKRIKQEKPLILNITNAVSMDLIANGLLSLGASPIMSQASEEVDELVQLAQAIVINFGTLNDDFITLCAKTCEAAQRYHKPIIFDPVGAGASIYRTESSLAFLKKYPIAILRGNAAEIMALGGKAQATKGVDSLAASHAAIADAKKITAQYATTVVISGEKDFIVTQTQEVELHRGSALMPMITGTGCLLTAVIAAFHAVEQNRLLAAQCATLFYCICGELAEKQTQAPGSFRTAFLDALAKHPEHINYV